MKERRKFIRIEAPIVITYKLGDAAVSKKTITRDFSEGGIRFPVYEKMKIGTSLELQIETPFDTMPIFTIGEVVWARALSKKEGREIYDVGVRFTEMKSFDKERMSQTTQRFLAMGKKYHAA